MAVPRFFAPVLAAAGLLLALQGAPARAADTPAGPPMQVEVEATDGDHRVFRVRQRVPVVPGPLKLFFPQWLPGQHAALGEIGRLAGLQIQANGRALPWRRDPAYAFAFLLDVPAGVPELHLAFEYLSPVSADTGRVVMSREMINLQWQSVLLYRPAPTPARCRCWPPCGCPRVGKPPRHCARHAARAAGCASSRCRWTP